MGINLMILANHKVSFKEPELVIETFTKKLNLDFSKGMIYWFTNLYYDYPIPLNEISINVYKEFSGDWKKQWEEGGYLCFKGPLCTILINENILRISSFFRFAFYAGGEDLAKELSLFVKGLVGQIGGTEAIFLPDSIPFAQDILGSVATPAYKQGIPINLKELGKMYDEKIYKMNYSFEDVKIALLDGYGKPCKNSKEIEEKEMLGYCYEKYHIALY